jgi:hypothetical protein
MAYTMLAPTTAGNALLGASGTIYRPTNMAFIQNVAAGDIESLAALGCTFPSSDSIGRDNVNATTDPGTSNDVTQDYTPGVID